MKVGEEFDTLARIEEIFAEYPTVQRIQVERRGQGKYAVTVMDAVRPNDLRKIAKLNGLDYERHVNRNYEMVRGHAKWGKPWP